MILAGVNIKPRDVAAAKALIGKRVKYLCGGDIDKSGRGYYFPKLGTVESCKGHFMTIGGSIVHRSTLVEMVLLEDRHD